ncbi:MAG: hypothetical protein JSV64_00340 [Candidatus Bathyarchaeota archaeon]|nr:MAG: hypothetical protein JSV64_00340 [Candidatus Bathyarchaeota archaeon]
MPGELYDYIVSILAVGIIFVSGVLAIPAINFINMRQVDEQQLRNTALNVFNAILLGAGSPADWGSVFPFEPESVDFFGLAYAGQSSLYVLDADKLQRLDELGPSFITYEEVKEKLGLEEYGFNLKIFRPFRVDWAIELDPDDESVWFAVNVSRNEDQRPLPNAEIKSTILATARNVNPKGDPIYRVTSPSVYFTDALGFCEANESIDVPSDYILDSALALLEVSVAGMSTIVTAQTSLEYQNLLKIHTFGDTITLTFREDNETDPATWERRVLDISSYNYDEITQIFDGREALPPDLKITQGIGYETWSSVFPGLATTNPMLLLFTLRVKNPNRLIIIPGPFSLWDAATVFDFGPESGQKGYAAVKLRRYVVFSSMTFVAELTLWKE